MARRFGLSQGRLISGDPLCIIDFKHDQASDVIHAFRCSRSVRRSNSRGKSTKSKYNTIALETSTDMETNSQKSREQPPWRLDFIQETKIAQTSNQLDSGCGNPTSSSVHACGVSITSACVGGL